MPMLTAGSFLSFAYKRTPKAKTDFVRDAIRHQLEEYKPPPDYWFRLRTPLISMIAKSNYSDAAMQQALAKTPAKRRDEFGRILTAFMGSWPRRRPVPVRRPRLLTVASGLTISCRPHAAATLDDTTWFLRFLYPLNATPDRRVVAEFEILRRASGGRATPGILHIPANSILRPRVATEISNFIDAEAAEFVRLWKRHGGPPD